MGQEATADQLLIPGPRPGRAASRPSAFVQSIRDCPEDMPKDVRVAPPEDFGHRHRRHHEAERAGFNLTNAQVLPGTNSCGRIATMCGKSVNC
jgi:hypothetical protein